MTISIRVVALTATVAALAAGAASAFAADRRWLDHEQHDPGQTSPGSPQSDTTQRHCDDSGSTT